MTGNRFDENKKQHLAAQGSFVQPGASGPAGLQPNFTRMVVLDVIFDPSIIDETKIAYWEHTLKVSNIKFAAILPRNTIIAQRILNGSAPASELPMFLFPFFPSHLALPCKPGEHVWVIFEHSDAQYSEMGYWMCRINEPHIADDVNHTHSPRQFDPSFSVSTKSKFEGKKEPVYEFRNGVTDVADGQRYVVAGTAFISGDETVYEKLLDEPDAAKIMQYDAVPRVHKRPADLVLEGSNNSVIVLGTDRSGPIAKYETDENKGKVPTPSDDLQNHAGSVDIVAGLGQTSDTGGSRVKSTRLSGAQFIEELGKSKNELAPHEGDPDFKNDRSRVLVSQKTKPDEKFEIDGFTGQFEIEDDSTGSGAVVIKSDKLRLIARSDVTILVKGISKRDENGQMVESDSEDDFAAVVIKTNGDIVFKPATKGVIKLGGEDANLTPLCGTAITGPTDGSGLVTAAPLIGSMLDSKGGGGVSGEFAKKVLIK